jgi:chromosome segregation ATPase
MSCSHPTCTKVLDNVRSLEKARDALRKLKSLDQNVEVKQHIEELEATADALVKKLNMNRESCLKDGACSIELRRLNIDLDRLANPVFGADEEVNGQKSLLMRRVAKASEELMESKSDPEKLNTVYDSAKSRMDDLEDNIERQNERLYDTMLEYESMNNNYNEEVTDLKGKLDKTSSERASLERDVEVTSKRISDIDTITDDIHTSFENEVEKTQDTDDKLSTLLAREANYTSTIDRLTNESSKLKDMLLTLEQKHQQEISQLRESYARMTSNGERVESEELEALKRELRIKQDSIKRLENIATMAASQYKELKEQLQNDERPELSVLQESFELQTQLASEEKMKSALNAKLQECRKSLSKLKLETATKVHRLRQNDRHKLEQASQNVASLTKKLAQKENAILKLEASLSALERKRVKLSSHMSEIVNKLKQRIYELERTSSSQRENADRQISLYKSRMEANEAVLEQRLRHAKDQMERNFKLKVRDLKSKMSEINEEMERKQRHQVETQSYIDSTRESLKRQQKRLDEIRKDYDSQLKALKVERAELQSKMTHYNERFRHFSEVEKQQMDRLNMMQENHRQERERFEHVIAEMKENLKRCEQSKRTITTNLNSCVRARSDLMARNEELRSSNESLKDELMSMKRNMSVMQDTYEQKLAEISKSFAAESLSLRECAKELKRTQDIHNHNREMYRKAQELEKELERKLDKQSQNEETFEELLRARTLAEEEISNLRASLLNSKQTKIELETMLRDTRKQLKQASEFIRKMKAERDELVDRVEYVMETKNDELDKAIIERDATKRAAMIHSKTQMKELEHQNEMNEKLKSHIQDLHGHIADTHIQIADQNAQRIGTVLVE